MEEEIVYSGPAAPDRRLKKSSALLMRQRGAVVKSIRTGCIKQNGYKN